MTGFNERGADDGKNGNTPGVPGHYVPHTAAGPLALHGNAPRFGRLVFGQV